MLGTKRDATRAVVLHKRFMQIVFDAYEMDNVYDLQDYAYEEVFHEIRYLDGGWQFIGMGLSRACYLSPAGIVYKVQHDPFSNSNEREVYNADCKRHLLNKIPGVRIPEMRLIESRQNWPVIAAEYVECEPNPAEICFPVDAENECEDCGFPVCISDYVRLVCAEFGMRDGHSYNVMLDSAGNIVLIDLGG